MVVLKQNHKKMQKECSRCGEVSFFLSEEMISKLNLSRNEKDYIFQDGEICVCCILQLKTRLTIKECLSALRIK